MTKKRYINKLASGGFTLTEIIVAFSMLLIGMAMVYTSVVVAGKLITKAEQTRQDVEERMNAYYSEDADEGVKVNLSAVNTERIEDTWSVNAKLIKSEIEGGVTLYRLNAVDAPETTETGEPEPGGG